MSKKTPLLFLIVVLLGGLGYGATRLKQTADISSRADAEAKSEAAEQKECQEHLALFYKAWKKYRADNKGANPSSLEAMIPKYIPDTSVLLCPTAVRLDKMNKHLDRGNIKIDGKTVDVTYGFRWMSAGFSMQAKKQGDTIPIVVCKCHQQAMYTLSYNKVFREAAFDDEERGKLIPAVANAPILGVRMNGKVEALDLSTNR